MLFFKTCNHARGGQASWLKDHKEITDFNIIAMDLSLNEQLLFMKFFYMRLLFLMIPKPLKQYTLFKKDNPFRSPSRRLMNRFLQKNSLTPQITISFI